MAGRIRSDAARQPGAAGANPAVFFRRSRFSICAPGLGAGNCSEARFWVRFCVQKSRPLVRGLPGNSAVRARGKEKRWQALFLQQARHLEALNAARAWSVENAGRRAQQGIVSACSTRPNFGVCVFVTRASGKARLNFAYLCLPWAGPFCLNEVLRMSYRAYEELLQRSAKQELIQTASYTDLPQALSSNTMLGGKSRCHVEQPPLQVFGFVC